MRNFLDEDVSISVVKKLSDKNHFRIFTPINDVSFISFIICSEVHDIFLPCFKIVYREDFFRLFFLVEWNQAFRNFYTFFVDSEVPIRLLPSVSPIQSKVSLIRSTALRINSCAANFPTRNIKRAVVRKIDTPYLCGFPSFLSPLILLTGNVVLLSHYCSSFLLFFGWSFCSFLLSFIVQGRLKVCKCLAIELLDKLVMLVIPLHRIVSYLATQ